VNPVEAFWAEFVAATGIDAPFAPTAFAEGSPSLATELGRLVRDGPKRATAGVWAEYRAEGEPLPAVGAYWVVVDGEGNPLCIIRTTRVELRRFGAVDEQFAWEEAEGDRSLAYWREAHLGYLASVGIDLDDDTLMVLEWFEQVWPRPDRPARPTSPGA
jgi:uncharacterized protein YhfF